MGHTLASCAIRRARWWVERAPRRAAIARARQRGGGGATTAAGRARITPTLGGRAEGAMQNAFDFRDSVAMGAREDVSSEGRLRFTDAAGRPQEARGHEGHNYAGRSLNHLTYRATPPIALLGSPPAPHKRSPPLPKRAVGHTPQGPLSRTRARSPPHFCSSRTQSKF